MINKITMGGRENTAGKKYGHLESGDLILQEGFLCMVCDDRSRQGNVQCINLTNGVIKYSHPDVAFIGDIISYPVTITPVS